ncbi:MAG: hypothetical protein M3238_01445 [Actinomycetota bacterium]|nr:hypothetical protein [Actinomycetota bacterium]
MRRSLVVSVALTLVFGALTSSAGGEPKNRKKKGRVATAEYFAPAYFSWNPTGEHNIGGVTFTTGGKERFVSIKIEDDLGTPVSAAAGQDPEGDNTVATTEFCSETTTPLPIEPGLELTVFVFVGPCTSPLGPAFATQGKVTATFTSAR